MQATGLRARTNFIHLGTLDVHIFSGNRTFVWDMKLKDNVIRIVTLDLKYGVESITTVIHNNIMSASLIVKLRSLPLSSFRWERVDSGWVKVTHFTDGLQDSLA